MSKNQGIHREILKVEDNNFLDDKRAEYMAYMAIHFSTWMFIQQAMQDAVEEYANITGTSETPEHKKIMKFLFEKTK